jgi:hypothetical protein
MQETRMRSAARINISEHSENEQLLLQREEDARIQQWVMNNPNLASRNPILAIPNPTLAVPNPTLAVPNPTLSVPTPTP